ncbi:hypothetical protein [Angustibacter aerolatus]
MPHRAHLPESAPPSHRAGRTPAATARPAPGHGFGPRRGTAVRVALGALVAGLLALLVAPPASAASPQPVVVVGVTGVRWSDVGPSTPTLQRLAQTGALADVAVRSVRTATCPVEGWLALSAGRRAGDAKDPRAVVAGNQVCRALPAVSGESGESGGGAGVVQDWNRYVAAATAEKFSAQPGLLGDTLAAAGTCGTAVGPGAAVALARSDGTVGSYLPADAVAQVPATLGSCPLTVVDVGSVRDPADAPRGDAEQGVATVPGDRAALVAAADAAHDAAVAGLPADARVLVVSLADSGRTPHLQLLAATGPGFPAGWVRTGSTRQTALVQATDLTPTVLDLLGVPGPSALVGSGLRPLSSASGAAPSTVDDRLRKVLDLDLAAQRVQPLVGPFFTGIVAAQLLLYGVAAVVLRRRWAEGSARSRVLRWVGRLAVVFASVPVATYLANTWPWWRSAHPLAEVVAAVAAYVVVIVAVVTLGPWRRLPLGPLGAVSAVTAVVLAADIVTGSRLQTASLMGLQPVVAGRFYGFSNVAFALFATAVLLVAVVVADALVRRGRRVAAAAAVAGIGVVGTALDVAPRWGSDFGGPLAMLPAFAVLTLLVLGLRLSWRRLLLIGVGTVVVLAAVSVADWLRPAEDRTHLGRFVQTVADGGALQVIGRKAGQNLSILVSSPLSLLIPFAAVFVALVLMRPSSWGARALQRAYDDSPTLRHGTTCLLLLLAIGFAVNDSGTVIPAIGATLAGPLLIATSMRALDERQPPAVSAERDRRTWAARADDSSSVQE